MGTSVSMPMALQIGAEGAIVGASRVYRKHLGDMAGIYADTAAYESALNEHGTDQLVYEVQEQRYGDDPGALTIGTSRLLPGRYGDEFAVTRGHLHAIADRAELYYGLSGRGVMLLETVDGETSAIELSPGRAVNVPGHWIHRSVNVGDEPFVTMFCYSSDAGQDYDIIGNAGGMKNLLVADSDAEGGWVIRTNPQHSSYQERT